MRDLGFRSDYSVTRSSLSTGGGQRAFDEVQLNDSQLVRGLRERNSLAVRYLSECWLPSIWRFVYVRVDGDQHLAEDIVSECVLALIHEASDPEKEILNVGGWLRGVAANKVNDHFRAAARVQHLLDQARPDHDHSAEADPVRQQELKERQAAVRNVLDSLGDAQRMALEWKYLDRLTVKEIAVRLELTEKAAESVLFRARCEFRERFERTSDELLNSTATGPHEAASDSVRTATKRSPSSQARAASKVDLEADGGDSEQALRQKSRPLGAGQQATQAESQRAVSETEQESLVQSADAEHSMPVSSGE